MKYGNYQLVCAVTMDTICAPIPIVNTKDVVSELKSSYKLNTTLQNSSVSAEETWISLSELSVTIMHP